MNIVPEVSGRCLLMPATKHLTAETRPLRHPTGAKPKFFWAPGAR